MTERGENSVSTTADAFTIGRSALAWDGETLVISIDETTAPIPRALRGCVRVKPAYINEQEFCIDDQGLHHWRPIAPRAQVSVAFSDPALKWSGHGYLDTNDGEESLDQAFRYWDWSRVSLPGGESAILYNTDLWTGSEQLLAVKFDAAGAPIELAPPPVAELPPAPIWRIKRRTRAENGGGSRIVKTLEDTPFYSRSIIESRLMGIPCTAMHESFSGSRFRLPLVKAMLPFRMPRIAR